MSFLLFIILIIVIVTASNNNKNTQNNNAKYQTPTYSNPTYNQHYCSRSSIPKLKFYSKKDTLELFGYTITNSLFYTSTSKSDMPFAIYTKSTPNFGETPSEGLNYWPNYNQISKTQQGYFIKWLANGKPYIEELGYAYIYYYGLEYRALVEKQDQKEVLFEIIDLVNKFKRLRYGYDLIVYLILSIKNFSQDEIDKILVFLKNNELEYMYNPAYNSIIKNLTPSEDYHVKFSPYQFLNNDEYNNLSDRKNELLSYYFEKITENLKESELYSVKTQTYNYYMAMAYYHTSNLVTYNAIVPSTKVKRLWNQARKIIKDEIKQTVKKFDSSSNPLTEIEKLAYLPSKLRNNINYSSNHFDFGEKTISDIGTIAEKLGFNLTDNFLINQRLYDYENSIFLLDTNTQELLKNRINYDALIKLFKTDIPKNLQWLKSLSAESDIIRVRSEKSQLYPIERVIITEGITEEILLPVFARLCGYDFDKTGTYLISAGGKNQVVKLFYKLYETLKLPVYILLDKDAESNLEEIKPKLREFDKIHLLKSGEFEDLLPPELVQRTLNDDFKNFSQIELETLKQNIPMAKLLEELFKEKGLHEFKKSEFAEHVARQITSKKDVSTEIADIVEEIKSKK